MKSLTPAKMVMFVFVAIGMLITFYLVKTLTAKEPPPRMTMRTVPLTLSELEPGTMITDMHVGLGPVPNELVTGDSLLTVEGIVGRVVKKKIPVTELIRGSDLYPIGQTIPLKTQEGFTAMSLALADTPSMVEGLFKPEDYLDIYYTPNVQGGDARYQRTGGMTIKLFKGVQVIAINRSYVQKDLEASRNSVTVAVRNEDAALLRLASTTGTLSFSATNNQSAEATVHVKDPDRPTVEEILQLPPIPEEPKPPEPDRYTTYIWKRSSGSRQGFVNGLPSDAGLANDPASYPQLDPSGQPTTRMGTGTGYGAPRQPANGAGGLWSPNLSPQPGSVPATPPPGQERFAPPVR